jgi:hypothetical protein
VLKSLFICGVEPRRQMIVVEPLQAQRVLRIEPVGALVQDVGADDLDVDAHLIHAVDLRLRERPHRLAVRLGAQRPDHRELVGRLEDLRRHEMRVEVDHGRLSGRAAETGVPSHPSPLGTAAPAAMRSNS